MDDAFKKGALNIHMLRLGCCLLPPYQNFWLRAWWVLEWSLPRVITNQ